MNDKFYAIFCRVSEDDRLIKATQKEAEDGAARLAEKHPHNQYYVMKTITKYAADPHVVRTEIEPEN